MTTSRRLAFALLLVFPLALSAGGAFAFSYGEGPAGYGNGDTYADPDSRFGAMSEHMSQMYGAPDVDYSEMLTGNSGVSQNSGAVSVSRMPTNIGGNR
jgi:hypothetical protein